MLKELSGMKIYTRTEQFPEDLRKLCGSCAQMSHNPEFPLKITDIYAAGIQNAGGPLFLQAIPSIYETSRTENESDDPLSERKYQVSPGLIRRYADRVLLLVTDVCDMHCRHCFRRSFSGSGSGIISDADLLKAREYIESESLVHEIILSGGDPLTIAPGRLGKILKVLDFPERRLVFRIGTRVPVVSPSRICGKLLSVLKRPASLWIVVQINHPREISGPVLRAVTAIRKAGIPILNQSVLLRGVNDSVDILKNLCHLLVEAGIKPYYIFQGDLAAGTSHFRVPLKRGLEIMKALRSQISGTAMPVYAVDLPDGGGKIPLTENYFLREEDGYLVFCDAAGKEYSYPAE